MGWLTQLHASMLAAAPQGGKSKSFEIEMVINMTIGENSTTYKLVV